MKINASLILSSFFFVFLALISCAPKPNEAAADTEDQAMEAGAETAQVIVPFEQVDGAVKSQINGFLADYFALNQKLIEDNFSDAKTAAAKFSGTVKQFDTSRLTGEQMDFFLIQVSKVRQGLERMSASQDIEQARTELATISDGMYALVKAYHPHETTLYYQYCPMAKNGQGANWLSQTKELVNPYMGQMMLECGKMQETLH